MKNNINFYFDLILISIIWLSWLIVINLIQVNQIVYYYKYYPEKIILADKNILYFYPIAFSFFIIYNFILSLFNLKRIFFDVINLLITFLSFLILIKIFYLNF
ncbi:MAG: hypothetical protein KatS3mg095_0254 [Candidatus Parcubacteria bacterium]|nr:MAG: hypothetical protein KatS3mg095_0254 [Candidatus Parcubacteria bacterium]